MLRECHRVLKPGSRSAGYVIHTPSGLTQAGERRARAFHRKLRRLDLDVETIVGIHGTPVPMTQFVEFVGGGQ